VTLIGKAAFSGCSNLESITLPFVGDSIKTSDDKYQYPLGYIFGVDEYTDGVATTQYYYGYNMLKTTFVTYYIPSSLKNVTITGGNILFGAFYNCSGLESITVPDGVTSIAKSAFYNCSGLTSITIPDSVTFINYGAFAGCGGLESITLPFVGDSVSATTAYSSNLFGYIFGSSSYIGGVETRQTYADYAYVTYYIPSSLKRVTITGGEILYGAFSGCGNVTSITIPDSVTSIGEGAFDNCSNLRSIVIPSSVTSIGKYAFYGCSSLTRVTFDNTNGWWYSASSDAASGASISSSDLNGSITAAEYLTNYYAGYYWKRS
jgi:hypothetical protein